MKKINIKIRLDGLLRLPSFDRKFDGDTLREQLLERQFKQIQVEGLPHGNHTFFVEDDSTFIVDSYMDLREKLQEGATSSGSHYACLDDSRVEISSKWRKSKVLTIVKVSDDLGIRKHALRCSVYEYFSVWESLCLQLSAAAGYEPGT